MRGWLTIAVCALCGCTFDTAGDPPRAGEIDAAPGAMPDPVSRKTLTLRTPDFGASIDPVAQTLDGFPVAVVLQSDPDLVDAAGAIAIIDSDAETLLPFEVASFDRTAGTLLVRISVPRLDVGTGADRTRYLYCDTARRRFRESHGAVEQLSRGAIDSTDDMDSGSGT
jgi:hypothetical protein